MNPSPNIVITGAGFAGLAASRALCGSSKVTVIDPNPTFEFLPNIHELVSGLKSPADLRLDTAEIVTGRKQEHVKEKVMAINREQRTVTTDHGRTFPYDTLILSVGGVNHDRGVEGVDEHAFAFKSAADCQAIGQRLRDLENIGQDFSVVIVGGGAEGVETLGEILRKYGNNRHITVKVVEAGAHLLPQTTDKVSKKIRELCQGYAVEFYFNKPLTKVEADKVHLADGQVLESELTVWTGGVKVNPLLRDAGLIEAGAEWPVVQPTLQSMQDAHILIIGDSVEIAGKGEKQAYHALAMGKVAGENAKRLHNGKDLEVFDAAQYPSVYSFGNLSCFVVYKDQVLAGLPLAKLKEAIYQFNMGTVQDPFREPFYLSRAIARAMKGYASLSRSLLETPLTWFDLLSVRWL